MWRYLLLVTSVLFLSVSSPSYADGDTITDKLWIKSVIKSQEKDLINALWQEGGRAKNQRGDEVIWGYFHANPNDVAWGDKNNPDVFVKIWFDVSGRTDVNFFHVSVPDIFVYSTFDKISSDTKRATMDYRYVRHYYQNGKTGVDYPATREVASAAATGTQPNAYDTINGLRIGALINSAEKGDIQAAWRLGGTGVSARGDQVVWGYFYANPQDVSWGNANNPDAYVKIWFDVSGRVDVNFFHVSVPNIKVFSGFGGYQKQALITTNDRYTRHEYSLTHGNNKPVVSPLSLQVRPSEPNQIIGLLGSDADGDTLQYELVSPAQGTGYTAAFIKPNEAKLYLTLANNYNGIISLRYRATDGKDFSEPANIDINVTENLETSGLGFQPINPRDYANIDRSKLSGRLLGAPGAEPSLPRQIDLSSNFPPAGNQGNQNSCVAWSTAYALKSYQERMEENWDLVNGDQPNFNHIFSPAFIYNQINGGVDEGSDPAEALDLIIQKGAATWATMPYNENDFRTQPSSQAFREAIQFKGVKKYTADGIQGIKKALANRQPVIGGIFIYNSFQRLKGNNSVYNSADTACDPSNACGHAVTIVGYDDDKYGGALKILNSWGTSWGDNGYFWLPYDFARHTTPWGALLDTAIYLEDADNKIVVPPPTPQPKPQNDLANLQVESWSAQYNASPNGGGELQYSVKNTGAGTAVAGADVNLMLSEDTKISSNDTYVVYETIPFDLKPGETAYRDASNAIAFNFPSDLASGTYYMAMWVNGLNVVEETDYEDNVSAGERQVTIEDNLPDLIVKNWYTQWNDAGEGTLEYNVSNEGGRATTTTDWDVNLVLSRDEIIGNGDEWVLFSERATHILEPGGYIFRDQNRPGSFNLYRDISGQRVTAGDYYMGLWIDSQNRQPESDENNNYSIGNNTVTISNMRRLSTENAAPQESYNGKPLPTHVTWRKVKVIQQLDGSHRLELLNDADTKPLFDKEVHSADAVISPTTKRTPMPQANYVK